MGIQEKSFEIEISFKSLIFHILYKWRVLLIIAFILSVILGGYKFISGYKLLNDENYVANQDASYQSNLKTYEESKKTLETDLSNLNTSLERQKEYNEKSELMKINPFDKKFATMSYFVDSKFQIMPNMQYQDIDKLNMLLRSYITLSRNGELYSYLIDNLSFDIELRYLKEIISVYPEYDTRMLFVEVVHNDSNICTEILDLINSFYEESRLHINEIVGEHSLLKVDQNLQTIVDFDLDNTQKYNLQLVKDYEKSINDKENEINALTQPVKFAINKMQIIKKSLKYTILGFALGLFLTAFYYILYFTFTNKIYNTKNIKSMFHIRTLGVVDKKKRKQIFGFIDRLIYSLEGKSNIKIDEDEVVERIANNLIAYSEVENIEKKTIIFTGTSDINLIENICNNVSKNLTNTSFKLKACNNISYYAKTIEEVKDCSAVVLIEEMGKSTYLEIGKQIECITDLNKIILGAVYLQ